MTLTLTLIRHADAVDHHPQGDRYRPLSSQGIKQCIQLADKLRADHHHLSHCICSPAIRAISTIVSILNHLWYRHQSIHCDAVLYNGDLVDIIDMIRKTDTRDWHLVIIGHNTELSQLAGRVLSNPSIVLKKSQYLSIQVQADKRANLQPSTGHILSNHVQET